MKLQGVHDGDVFATRYRTVLREHGGSFVPRGRLPIPEGGWPALAARFKTAAGFKTSLAWFVGQFPSVNVWWFGADAVLASANRWLFASDDGGRSFRPTLELPASSGPAGVLSTALCEHRGDLYVGEYPLARDATPRVWRSDDWGSTWACAMELPGVRHVHSIQVDPYGGELWMTTGDAGDACRIGRLRGPVTGGDRGNATTGRRGPAERDVRSEGGIEFEVAVSGDQRFRAVELAFTRDAVIWGVDSSFASSNPVYRLPRAAIDRSGGPPASAGDLERLCDAGGPVYYAEQFTVDDTDWLALTTAVEPGADRVGPSDQQPDSAARARVLVASGATDYRAWYELAAYEKRPVPADRWQPRPVVQPANAYVYLASEPSRGLLVNPYNTARDGGRILRAPPSTFSSLSRGEEGTIVPAVGRTSAERSHVAEVVEL